MASIPKNQARAPARFLELAGDDLERYCRTAAALIRAGRLNKWYPEPEGCAAYLEALSPSWRRGAYSGARISLSSGLPALQDILSVQVDKSLCSEFLAGQRERAEAGRGQTPKVAAKTAYYQKLAGAVLPPLHRLEVKLRRIFPEKGAAAFEASIDRYEPSEADFVRYTLFLEQKDASWEDALIERRGDYSRQTDLFRTKMERYLQDESELAFLLLGKMPGVRVEEITRTRIGPLWSPWVPAPEGWIPADSGEYILHFPMDKASVYLDGDRDDDPFSTMYRRFLSEETRSLVEKEASQLGYRVHKDRKFACTAKAAGRLREKLSMTKTNNIIYTLS